PFLARPATSPWRATATNAAHSRVRLEAHCGHRGNRLQTFGDVKLEFEHRGQPADPPVKPDQLQDLDDLTISEMPPRRCKGLIGHPRRPNTPRCEAQPRACAG